MADSATIEALREALDEEYRSRAFYNEVIQTFGPVRPFVHIVEAEDQHVDALLTLLCAFGVDPAPDDWAGRVAKPASLVEACKAGLDAEIENATMFDRLMPQISDPSTRAVMRRLQRASRKQHLPAFRRCLERETGRAGAALQRETCRATRPDSLVARMKSAVHAGRQPSSVRKKQQDFQHKDRLLDEALADTFPASDPPAMLVPAPDLDDEGGT